MFVFLLHIQLFINLFYSFNTYIQANTLMHTNTTNTRKQRQTRENNSRSLWQLTLYIPYTIYISVCVFMYCAPREQQIPMFIFVCRFYSGRSPAARSQFLIQRGSIKAERLFRAPTVLLDTWYSAPRVFYNPKSKCLRVKYNCAFVSVCRPRTC